VDPINSSSLISLSLTPLFELYGSGSYGSTPVGRTTISIDSDDRNINQPALNWISRVSVVELSPIELPWYFLADASTVSERNVQVGEKSEV
jgi:hypothetical protein